MATKKQLAALRKARAAKKQKSLDGVTDILVKAKEKAQNANPLAIKVIVGTAAVGLAFLVGRKIYTKIKAGAQNRKNEDALNKLDVSGATISRSYATGKAADLESAMNGANVNLDAVKSVFNDIGDNVYNINLLIQEFGYRGYAYGGASNKESAQKLNLLQWLRKELGELSVTDSIRVINLAQKRLFLKEIEAKIVAAMKYTID